MRSFRLLLPVVLIAGAVLFAGPRAGGADSGVLASGPSGVSGTPLSKLNVGLLKSGYTARYFVEKWQYEQVIYKWLTFLAESGIKHRLVTDAELERGEIDEFTVLVIPTALCLSPGERDAIGEFLSKGRGVVASWGAGVRSHDGDWSGWDFLEGLTGSEFGGYIRGRPAAWVALSGGSPLSVGLGPGFRLELVGGWKIALEGRFGDGFWSDFNLNPWQSEGGTGALAVLTYAPPGRGRTAWLSFNVAEVISNPANQTGLKKLLLNAVNWVGRIPISDVWHWPDYHKAAAVFSQDVEYLFENAAGSVEVLKEEGVSGTFFCVSDLAMDNAELVRAFAEIGEVGTHSDDHRQFEGQPFDVQYKRLKKSADALNEMSGAEIKGMRPPYELCDEATLKAWAVLGGEYVFGQPEYNPRMMPELYTVPRDPSLGLDEDKTLVLLPRAVRDDHTTLVVEAHGDNDTIFEEHRLDMERVYGLGGLCMFGYHSNLVCLPERVEVLSRMVRYAKSLDLWLTTAKDVARWWKSKADVSVDLAQGKDGTIVLSVRNAGTETIDDVSIVVYLPGATGEVKITSNSSEIGSPRHTVEGQRLAVHLGALAGETMESYTVETFQEHLPEGSSFHREEGDEGP
jgi:peptidoglycan/xylan/chitin deacetylase (PgdA/CDA1 family)